MTAVLDPSRDLGDIAWDFAGDLLSDRLRLAMFDARKHHWYPATYIPELPFTLIELLSNPGDRVLDPFAGVGTTIWQARVLGRVAYGIESNTVAHKLTTWFWTLMEPHVDLRSTVADVRELVRAFDGERSNDGPDDARSELLAPWFSSGTFQQIQYLMRVVDGRLSDATRAAINIGTSALLKPMCEQRNGWGCIADNMIPKAAPGGETRPFLERLLRRVTLLCRDIRRVRTGLDQSSHQPDDYLIHGSVLDSTHGFIEPIDLVVTSPPYPGMTDYSTSQRLSYYWLGIDPAMDMRVEIGARRKRFANGWVERYVREMSGAATRMLSTLRPGGYLCMVLPRFTASPSGPDRRLVAVEDVLKHLVELGCKQVWTGDRRLPVDRRHLNQRWATLEKERIVVFENRK